jgi:hypothetical protein
MENPQENSYVQHLLKYYTLFLKLQVVQEIAQGTLYTLSGINLW